MACFICRSADRPFWHESADEVDHRLKAVAEVLKVHQCQVLTQLKLTDLPVGLLINFNVPRLIDGITRLSL